MFQLQIVFVPPFQKTAKKYRMHSSIFYNVHGRYLEWSNFCIFRVLSSILPVFKGLENKTFHFQDSLVGTFLNVFRFCRLHVSWQALDLGLNREGRKARAKASISWHGGGGRGQLVSAVVAFSCMGASFLFTGSTANYT